MILVIEFSLYHTSLIYGISHFWCNFIRPKFLLMLNGLSKSCMFDTYFGWQKTMSAEYLSNGISFFVFVASMNKHCYHAQPKPDLLSCLTNYFRSQLYCHYSWNLHAVEPCLWPIIFLNITFISAVRIFVTRFSTTVTPPFHLRKRNWSSFFSLFLFFVLVLFLVLIILFLMFTYVKFMIA